MNRRGFLGALLKASAGFTILPAATTYLRQWKPQPQILRADFAQFIADETPRFDELIMTDGPTYCSIRSLGYALYLHERAFDRLDDSGLIVTQTL